MPQGGPAEADARFVNRDGPPEFRARSHLQVDVVLIVQIRKHHSKHIARPVHGLKLQLPIPEELPERGPWTLFPLDHMFQSPALDSADNLFSQGYRSSNTADRSRGSSRSASALKPRIPKVQSQSLSSTRLGSQGALTRSSSTSSEVR